MAAEFSVGWFSLPQFAHRIWATKKATERAVCITELRVKTTPCSGLMPKVYEDAILRERRASPLKRSILPEVFEPRMLTMASPSHVSVLALTQFF